MRLPHVVAGLLLGVGLALPARAPAQVNLSLTLSQRLGPELSIFAYSAPDHGAWRTTYRQWTPVTVYVYEGHYYRKSVRGARPMVIYRRNNEYFMPPEDRSWVGSDKRYNYKRQPIEEDRGRAKHKEHDDNPGRGRGRGNP